jgi:NNP family nitrate/nitrite transporter-like MFS transporter
MIQKHNPNYKWYILFLTMMTYAVIAGLERLCMPVLFKQIGDDLGLSVVAIGAVWGMDPLAGVFIGLPSGLLADRFGIKRSLTVLCILAGIFCALRGFSTSFLTLALTMFLFGLTAAATPSVVPKVTAEWFSGKRLALTNALLNVAWSIGSMFATQFSATVFAPALGGWHNVMFLYGAPAVVLGLLWLFTGREPDKTENPELLTTKIPFRQSLSHVIRIKEVWIIGLATLTNWGASMGFVGYLPLYLRNLGWTPTNADSTITVLSLMMCLGSVPLVLLSDKLKTRKGVLVICIGALVSCLALLPYVNTTGIWLLIAISGFIRAGAGSLFNVMIFETQGVGATYGGTAIGLASTISMLGAFLAPPLGNSLVQFNEGLPFTFWACLAAVGIPLLFLIKTKRNPATSYRQ